MFEIVKRVLKPQFILFTFVIISGIYYPQVLEKIRSATLNEESASVSTSIGDLLFTKKQLAKHNGENGSPLYLAILGNVYDVTKGKKHYGPGCAYNFFVGRDASVSFITGEFDNLDEEKADDVLSLEHSSLLGLANWQNFYHTDYIYKGKLIGRFYNEKGKPTNYYHKYMALLDHVRASKLVEEQLRTEYPDCNIEWKETSGTRVWCTNTSGGVERDWHGYPRKLYEIGSNNFRCACIRDKAFKTTAVMLKEYENCDDSAEECFYKVE